MGQVKTAEGGQNGGGRKKVEWSPIVGIRDTGYRLDVYE